MENTTHITEVTGAITPYSREQLREIMGEDVRMLDNSTVYGVAVSLAFNIMDVQQYLINKGYKIVILKGKATVRDAECSQDETKYGPAYVSDNRYRLIAVPTKFLNINRETLPQFVDSQEAIDMDYKATFAREVRSAILGFTPRQELK